MDQLFCRLFVFFFTWYRCCCNCAPCSLFARTFKQRILRGLLLYVITQNWIYFNPPSSIFNIFIPGFLSLSAVHFRSTIRHLLCAMCLLCLLMIHILCLPMWATMQRIYRMEQLVQLIFVASDVAENVVYMPQFHSWIEYWCVHDDEIIQLCSKFDANFRKWWVEGAPLFRYCGNRASTVTAGIRVFRHRLV